MTQKLFNDSEVYQKERPKNITKEQEDDFYQDMAEQIIDNHWSKSPIENIIHDLSEVSISDSGYEIAKSLEGYRMKGSYDIDSSFIEFLEGLDYEKRLILRNNVKDWVKAHNPKPKFKKGDKLLVVESIFYEMKKDSIIYITGNKEDEAVYYAHKNKDNNGGYILDYEEVENKCQLLED